MTETKRVGGRGGRSETHIGRRHAIMQREGSHASYSQAEQDISLMYTQDKREYDNQDK